MTKTLKRNKPDIRIVIREIINCKRGDLPYNVKWLWLSTILLILQQSYLLTFINKRLLTIGEISLGDFPLFLAPMEDITDPSFRMICKMQGADVMYTEFISSDGLIRDGHKSVRKLDIYDFERPIGIQLYGHLKDAMVEAALIAQEANPEMIDINFGCPVRKIANRGAGAGMLRNLPLMLDMTEAIVKTVDLPVTVKTRLGWDEDSKNIVEIAERLQDTGIKAITIHGRTRAQLYKGNADWTLIGAVKNNQRMKIPVIGNGDIDGPITAKEMFDKYGVDGIMIGRATVGRPWIFRDIRHYLNTGEILPEPTVNEKADLALRHLEKSLEFKEGKRAIYEMRRHLSNYFKGLPHFKETRLKLLTAIEVDDIKIIINEIRERWGDFRTDDITSVYNI
jgi:nifR3 family TIM-barrel protein